MPGSGEGTEVVRPLSAAAGDHPGRAPTPPLSGDAVAAGLVLVLTALVSVLNPDGTSGYVLDGYGGLHPFGGAPWVSTTAYWGGWDIARDVCLVPGTSAQGYVLDGFGGVHTFGGAAPVSAPYTGGHDEWRAVTCA